jgi:hypothetical protein
MALNTIRNYRCNYFIMASLSRFNCDSLAILFDVVAVKNEEKEADKEEEAAGF